MEQCSNCSGEQEGYNCTDCGNPLCGECYAEYSDRLCEDCMQYKLDQEQK